MKAFPSLYVHFNKTDEMAEPRLVANSHHGMDLRDYFAGQVMSHIFSYFMEQEEGSHSWGETKELVAIKSYELADAMMKAREQ